MARGRGVSSRTTDMLNAFFAKKKEEGKKEEEEEEVKSKEGCCYI